MKRFLLPVVATLFVTPVCLAEGVFKCTTEAGVTYQSAPCTESIATLVAGMPTTKLELRAWP